MPVEIELIEDKATSFAHVFVPEVPPRFWVALAAFLGARSELPECLVFPLGEEQARADAYRGRRGHEERVTPPHELGANRAEARAPDFRHARLLSEIWPPITKAGRDEAKALSDLLGDDHDLAVLRQEIEGAPNDFGSRDEVRAFVDLCDRRRAELEEAARGLGLLLYAEKPERHVGRVKRYFRVAHAG